MTTNRPVADLDTTSIQNDFWSTAFVSLIQFGDEHYGTADWNLRQVAITTALVLGLIRITTKGYKGIDWYALLHAIVSGYGSLVCVYLNAYGAEALTGTSEPLRSILCQGPLTSWHRLLPAITMGYGVFDIVEGFTHGIDFLMHGVATFVIMAYFCENDLAELIVPMLLMEISTVHLTVVRAEFFSEFALTLNMALFAVYFLLYRILVCPYLWWQIFTVSWSHKDDAITQSCQPWHFPYVVFVFGMFFNILNTFWAYKIVRKIIRKVTGKEKVKDKNQLKES